MGGEVRSSGTHFPTGPTGAREETQLERNKHNHALSKQTEESRNYECSSQHSTANRGSNARSPKISQVSGEAPSSDRSSSGERRSDTAPQTEMNFGKSKPAADRHAIGARIHARQQ